MDAPHVYVCAWALGCFHTLSSTQTCRWTAARRQRVHVQWSNQIWQSLEEGAGKRCSECGFVLGFQRATNSWVKQSSKKQKSNNTSKNNKNKIFPLPPPPEWVSLITYRGDCSWEASAGPNVALLAVKRLNVWSRLPKKAVTSIGVWRC